MTDKGRKFIKRSELVNVIKNLFLIIQLDKKWRGGGKIFASIFPNTDFVLKFKESNSFKCISNFDQQKSTTNLNSNKQKRAHFKLFSNI